MCLNIKLHKSVLSFVFCLITLTALGQKFKTDGLDLEVANVTAVSKIQQVNLENFKLRMQQPYAIPEFRNDGLKVDSIGKLIVNVAKVFQLLALIEENNISWYKDSTQHNSKKGCVDSFLLMKDGKLVVEEYFADSEWNKPHFQMSITKSITALAMGIAIDEKKVNSEYDVILEYLPELDSSAISPMVKDIKISDVLSMQSGIRLTNNFEVKRNVSIEECIPNILENCEMLTPGTVYKYQGIDPEIISHIIYNATGLSVEQLVAEKLFKPLGIHSYSFHSSPCGLTKTAAGMALTSRSMLKIGQLTLDNGNWHDQQIISENWMKKVNASVVDNGLHQYGFFWWQHQVKVDGKKYDIQSCRGSRGQFIYVIPELNSVAVFTSYGTRAPFKYLEEFIIPALL